MSLNLVKGRCPMGCGSTLFLGMGGYVTCAHINCPDPSAATKLLGETEHHHVVEFTAEGWTIQHPLRDRVDGVLFDCPATLACQAFDGAPVQLGRYRMIRADEGDEPRWRFEAL